MKFAVFTVLLAVLSTLASGAIIKRDVSEHVTSDQLVKEISEALENVKLVNEKLEELNSRICSLETGNQILLREAAFLRVHGLNLAKKIDKHLSTSPTTGAKDNKINKVLINIRTIRKQQDQVHNKLDSMKRLNEDLWLKVASLQKKLQKDVRKHLKITPEAFKEEFKKVRDAIEGVKIKHVSMNKKIDAIKTEFKDLWKEAISLKRTKRKKGKGTHRLITTEEPVAERTTVEPDYDDLIIPGATKEPTKLLSDVPWYRVYIFIIGIGRIILVFHFALFKIITSVKSTYEPM